MKIPKPNLLYFEITRSSLIPSFEITTFLSDREKVCKFCSKKQPQPNLFCVECNKREWAYA